MYVGALLQHSARQLKILPLPSLPACSGFPASSVVQNLPANTRDLGLIPGSGRSPGEGNGNPFQYSRPENPMDGGAWRATIHAASKSHDFITEQQQQQQ